MIIIIFALYNMHYVMQDYNSLIIIIILLIFNKLLISCIILLDYLVLHYICKYNTICIYIKIIEILILLIFINMIFMHIFKRMREKQVFNNLIII